MEARSLGGFQLALGVVLLGAFLALSLVVATVWRPDLSSIQTGSGKSASAVSAAALMPSIPFEANEGQAPRGTDFVVRARTGAVLIDDTGATFVLGDRTDGESLRLQLRDSESARPAAADRLIGHSNYLVGDDPRKWHTNVPTYGRVKYPDVYRGVDLVWRNGERGLEYDFVVAPGAKPGRIAFTLHGADRISIGPSGELIVEIGSQTIRQSAPRAFQPPSPQQRRGENRRASPTPVPAGFAVDGRTVRFRVGRYEHALPLVIDPALLGYSTYLGGTEWDAGHSIAVDASGAAYVTGQTFSTDLDVREPVQGHTSGGDGGDVFVSKLTPAGDALVYSTYLGGNNDDFGDAVAVDTNGAAYITGGTSSTDFNTVGQIETDADGTMFDAFVAKLAPDGDALTYSTYLGGSNSDAGNAIAVDGSGSAYVAGNTNSYDFDTLESLESYSGLGDAFVAKLTPEGGALAYSTYLGGDRSDGAAGIVVDASGAAYVSGSTTSTDFTTAEPIQLDPDEFLDDAFVAKLAPAGDSLVYSTYLGGTAGDRANGIAIDEAGAAYVAGGTNSTDFPTVMSIEDDSPWGDVFVSKLTADGQALLYSTYLGGDSDDGATGIAVDASGSAHVAGVTNSPNFDLAAELEGDSPSGDVFVSRLVPTGNALAFSTYLGGGARDAAAGIALDPSGGAYVTGVTHSTDFDTVAPIEGDSDGSTPDAFISKLAGIPHDPPPPLPPDTPPHPTPDDSSSPPDVTPQPRVPECAGRRATIVATSGVTFGTSDADVIIGSAAGDRIVGLAGPDVICARGGMDSVAGGSGPDRIAGQAHNDVLRGQAGNDTLHGGKGYDQLKGGSGDDVEKQ